MAAREGPGLPDRRPARRSARLHLRSYRDRARRSLRVRSRWHKEDEGRGTWIAVIDRDSLWRRQGQADRADRPAHRRQEAADPRGCARRDRTRHCASCWSRARAPSIREVLMDGLFRLTDLESRFPLNLNVLDRSRTPRVMGLRGRADRVARSTRSRCCSAGRTIASPRSTTGSSCSTATSSPILNLDRVIEIIRTEDEPKPVMMAEFGLNGPAGRGDPQHAAAQLAPA